MVRRGQSYRTQAQRDHRHRSRGGFTRQEQKRKKIREEKASLRERNLVRARFSARPIDSYADKPSRSANDCAVYGVYRDGGSWVLTGLSVTRYTLSLPDGDSNDQGSYVALDGREPIDPQDGVPIKTFDTKAAALRYVRADGSERVESGAYLVRPEHDPKLLHEKVDSDAYYSFAQSDARKVWLD